MNKEIAKYCAFLLYARFEQKLKVYRDTMGYYDGAYNYSINFKDLGWINFFYVDSLYEPESDFNNIMEELLHHLYFSSEFNYKKLKAYKYAKKYWKYGIEMYDELNSKYIMEKVLGAM